MKALKVWCEIDDNNVGLLFRWNESENCWICKMEDDFMQELGALPVDEDSDDDEKED